MLDSLDPIVTDNMLNDVSEQEKLVDADDIRDKTILPDSEKGELDEDIQDAADQLLVDHEHLEEEEGEAESDWQSRTNIVLESSKDALAPRTLLGYKRYLCLKLLTRTFVTNEYLYSLYKQFLAFVKARDGERGLSNVNNATVHCPQYIAEWIINSCEDPKDLSLGAKPFKQISLRAKKKLIDSSGTRDRAFTYSHALKMRATASYWFAYIKTDPCGTDPWLRTKSGEYQGNPSLSPMVSRYMRALQKKKVRC
jgi:hypothetical protein